MYIEKIELHRFKQFKSTSIALKPNLSLLVGGNNAGKSSILHALAVWEFCKTILEFSKGRRAWTTGGTGQGIGIGISEFSPISVPSLKHLWTNLKTQKSGEADGYTLKIKVLWTITGGVEKHLEFGLSLANDRLFIKSTDTNLTIDEVQSPEGDGLSGVVPKIAYLPPFAGITDKESRYSVAMRNRLIGQGLSGGVIRNVLYDMWQRNKKERLRLRGDKSKISSSELVTLRNSDPWEILLRALGELFQLGISVREFDDRYHTYLHMETFRGKMTGPAIKKAASDTPRDLMVEGSGFLQWLSVYALALSPDVDIVLLDEPDAHLHCSLQLELVKYLSRLATQKGKQVLMATHSTELIKTFDHKAILQVKLNKVAYLEEDGQKIGLLAGIGTNFAPKLHSLTQLKKALIVENEFDERILRIWAQKIGIEWPANIVPWYWNGGHKERRQLFIQLQRDIPDLKAISLRDRDDEPDKTVEENLLDKAHNKTEDGFVALKWRRRHIENYLIHLTAISRASGKMEADVRTFFTEKHGLAVPSNVVLTNVIHSIRDARGKEIMMEGANSVDAVFGISREDIAYAMLAEEVPQDVKTILQTLNDFCKK